MHSKTVTFALALAATLAVATGGAVAADASTDDALPADYERDVVDPDGDLSDEAIDRAIETAWANEEVRAALSDDATPSFEVWADGQLAGGVYGVRLGRVFFGESMFSRRTDASKVAFLHVARDPGIELIDCQLPNPHLMRLGAENIERSHFRQLLTELGASSA